METRTDLTEFTHKMDEIRQHISDIIVGQTKAVDMVLTCAAGGSARSSKDLACTTGVTTHRRTVFTHTVYPRPHAKRCSWHIRFQHENPRV